MGTQLGRESILVDRNDSRPPDPTSSPRSNNALSRLAGGRLDRLADRGQHFLLSRHLGTLCLDGRATVHEGGQFTLVAIHQLDLQTRLPTQGRRHTGGEFAVAGSNRALANGYLGHDILPSDWAVGVRICRSRAKVRAVRSGSRQTSVAGR